MCLRSAFSFLATNLDDCRESLLPSGDEPWVRPTRVAQGVEAEPAKVRVWISAGCVGGADLNGQEAFVHRATVAVDEPGNETHDKPFGLAHLNVETVDKGRVRCFVPQAPQRRFDKWMARREKLGGVLRLFVLSGDCQKALKRGSFDRLAFKLTTEPGWN